MSHWSVAVNFLFNFIKYNIFVADCNTVAWYRFTRGQAASSQNIRPGKPYCYIAESSKSLCISNIFLAINVTVSHVRSNFHRAIYPDAD